jgi:hypothetical protein
MWKKLRNKLHFLDWRMQQVLKTQLISLLPKYIKLFPNDTFPLAFSFGNAGISKITPPSPSVHT